MKKRLRRHTSWLFTFIAALALILAGIEAARAGTDALAHLGTSDLTHIMPDVSDARSAISLIVVTLVMGTCAILIAPRSAPSPHKISLDTLRVERSAYNTPVKKPFVRAPQHASQMDSFASEETRVPQKSSTREPASASKRIAHEASGHGAIR